MRAALHLVQRSFLACARHGEEHLLDGYAVGACGSLVGAAKGRPRMAAGRRIAELAGFPLPR
jgi:hypothetical protein